MDSLEFLRMRPRERPFVLSVGFFAAHAQDDAAEQYLPRKWSAPEYAGVTVPPPLRGDPRYLKALPPFLSSESNEGRIRFHKRFATPESYQVSMVRYYRLITEVDAATGELLDELQRQRVIENTLIVFTSDNGYFQADRGLADKWYPYEESIRVPLLVHDPRLPVAQRGITRDELVLNLDVAPTIVAAAGVRIPKVMQGRDLSPLYLRQPPTEWRDEFFYEHPSVTSKDRIPSSQGVIRRDWKFIDWPEFDYEQLFDLNHDPGEIDNRIDDAADAAQVQRMRGKLDRWRQRAQ
jgi:arylsulfatase A-like enzyme